MEKTITYKTYELNQDSQKEFFDWCLKEKLYRTSKDPFFNSRMKMFYNGKIPCENLTAIVAFNNDIPAGIITCEHSEFFHPAFALKNGGMGRDGNKIREEYDWGYYHLGMVSIYIKKAYRKKGIATNLWLQIEEKRINSLKEIPGVHKDSVPLFKALEMAYDIVNKKARFSYVTDKDIKFTNYKNDIHDLTEGLISQRDKDPCPLYPLRKREIINFSNELKTKTIKP